MSNSTLEMIALVLRYPDEEYSKIVGAACDILERALEDEGDAHSLQFVRSFKRTVLELSQQDLEELHTRTFDLSPVCSPDIGWHLYGENYERGTFLVHLRSLLHEHGIDDLQQLPDYLPSVLRLLSRMDGGQASVLAESHVLPALRKMVASFGEGHNPYKSVIQLAETILQRHVASATGVPDHE